MSYIPSQRRRVAEPFVSRAQQRFAFATKQPWAKEWADKTPDFKKLPQHVADRRKKKRRKGREAFIAAALTP